MIITKEISSLDEFEAWSGAKDTLARLTPAQRDQLFALLEDAYPDGMEESELNDFLWFEDNTINEWLNIDEDGNEIGSEEWAEALLHRKITESRPLSIFSNKEDMITDYLQNNYVKEDSEEDVLYEFNRYVLMQWHEHTATRLLRLTNGRASIDTSAIIDWLETYYDDEDEIQNYDDVIEEEFLEYFEIQDSNNEESEE